MLLRRKAHTGKHTGGRPKGQGKHRDVASQVIAIAFGRKTQAMLALKGDKGSNAESI